MSNISFSGLATGLDTGSIISQLVELKRMPIYRAEADQQSYQGQISALGILKTKLIALQDASKELDSANEFASLLATSSDEDFLTVEADSDAAAGNYTIEVQSLATAQKDVSQGYDSLADSIGEGIMSFTVGGETIDLNLSGYTSLETLKNEINDNVNGVSASIIFDGSETGGYHLVLSSEESGADGAFSVDMSGISGGTTPILTNNSTAQDAVVLVDGITVNTGNTADDVISGLTLNLLDAEIGKEIQVNIGVDPEGITDKVKSFVDAHNDLMSYIDTQKSSSGDLYGNSSVRSVSNRINNIFTSSFTTGLGDYSMFAQIGITRGDSNQLDFDETDFTDALENDFGSVRDLFIEREGNLGKMYLIDQAVEDMTDSVDGIFKIATDALNTKIDYTEDRIDRYERSVESYQLTLERKFTAMESMVAALQAQGNYLSSIQG